MTTPEEKPSSAEGRDEACPWCNGTGVIDYDECDSCGGRGMLWKDAPTPERPTTEEGEEKLAYAYLESVLPILAKEEYYREKPTRSMTYSAALWGLREGKRSRDGKVAREALARLRSGKGGGKNG